jgi:hypothetical protein
VFAREVGVAEEAIDGFLAEGLEYGVLLVEVEACLGLEVVGEGAVGDGVVALEGAAGGAGEAVGCGVEGGGDGAAGGERRAGEGTRGVGEDAKRGKEAEAVLDVVKILSVGEADRIGGADGVEEDTSAVL